MTTLEDLRVLDLAHSASGAYCARLFAGYGADVILVEPPEGSPLRSGSDWDWLSAGKRSITLDVKTEAGRRIFKRMTEQANVVIETFAPGTMESLGLAFADLYAVKRRIILASVTSAGGIPPREAQIVAGLNAFAATAIAAHNADAYEVPQHIEISVEESVAASLAPGGEPAPVVPGDPPFHMSEVAWEKLPPPTVGEHNLELYAEELGMAEGEIAELRSAGAI